MEDDAAPSPVGGGSLEICVLGECQAAGGEAASATAAGGDDLRVTFTEFGVRRAVRGDASADSGYVRVPLPRPVGSLRTTHCDATMRVSRGGRGGVFVLRRLQK